MSTVLGGQSRTVVSLHAHPDDEALLCGGTLAMLSAAGHRVVLVVATSGEAGLAAGDRSGGEAAKMELARRRVVEVEQSAAVLGCAKVVHLGYPDSGWNSPDAEPPGSESGSGSELGTASKDQPVPAGSFADLDLHITAERVAEVLRAEQADVLTVYDRNGGYGHPDHVRVHEVGLAAARLAGTPRVLGVTVDRTLLQLAVRVLAAVKLLPEGTARDKVPNWFSPKSEITHRISVRKFADRKRAALACHRSQTEGGTGPRTAGLLLRLPRPVFRRVCGTEWFVEYGVEVRARPLAGFFESAANEDESPQGGLRQEVR